MIWTVTLRYNTVVDLASDVSRSQIYTGFIKIVFVIRHTGNLHLLVIAIKKVKYHTNTLSRERMEKTIYPDHLFFMREEK